MKELVAALSQATANRLKSPILGSFVFSWIAWNHSYVIEFIFSTSPQKIQLAKSLNFQWSSDLLIPVLIAIAYTFILPLLQYWVDSARYLFIDKKRIEAQHTRQKDTYDSQTATSKSQAKSRIEYWHDRYSRDLDDWETQRVTLESNIVELEKDLNHEKVVRQSAEKQQQNLIEQINSSSEYNQQQQAQITDLKSKLESAHSTVENIIESIEKSKITDLTELIYKNSAITNSDIGELKRQVSGLGNQKLEEAADILLKVKDIRTNIDKTGISFNPIFENIDSLQRYLSKSRDDTYQSNILPNVESGNTR